MARLHELFSSKRKVSGETESRDCGRSYKITKDQVRLLLFKECDWRGRKILFDSSTIEVLPIDDNVKNKLSINQGSCVMEVSDGFAYRYKGPASDTNVLGEMMFGAVAMNYSGVSLKIHVLNNPHRLMYTKVFTVPMGAKRPVEPQSSSDIAMDTSQQTRTTAPLSVPSFHADEEFSWSLSFERGDSGFYGHSPESSVGSTADYSSMMDTWGCASAHDDMYTFPTPPSGRSLSSCNTSWQRRMMRNLSTRFDRLLSVPSFSNRSSDSQSQFGSTSGSSATCSSVSTSSGGSLSRRRTKLGLAFLITLTDDRQMEMLQHCASHSPQLENMFCRLRMCVMLSGAPRGRVGANKMVASLSRATATAVQWLMDLFNGPRLSPVWLNLVQSPVVSSQHKLAESLLTDLCSVLLQGDTKHTKFFISTLLTHVLTFHLGWVSTVSPYEMSQEDISPQHFPYNALWAQLSDLCGSIGCPPRAARTIIAGKSDKQFINKLLSVLTYFIRCGDIKKNVYKSEDFSCGPLSDCSVTSVPVKETVGDKNVSSVSSLKRTNTCGNLTGVNDDSAKCSSVENTESKYSKTVLPEELSIISSVEIRKVSTTLEPMSSCLKRSSTVLHSLVAPDLSELSENLSDEKMEKESVVFVLGEDEKLVGLKNKSNGGKSVKKSSKAAIIDKSVVESSRDSSENICDSDKWRKSESPARCCSQKSQHSKPIKHSGFKFEFDKYPQIVTNYMKSKNLEILDRHYIGKPGNLKLDNFQFDPTVVPPIQEERCENCYKCQLNESTLQTPTNASEFWSDMSNDDQLREHPTLHYANETVEQDDGEFSAASPKSFVRKRKMNTVVINLPDPITMGIDDPSVRLKLDRAVKESNVKHLRVVDVGILSKLKPQQEERSVHIGYQYSLLGGLTDHYVPDMILQGTLAPPSEWERDLRRDLELTKHVKKLQPAAIIGDVDQWTVRVLCGGGGGGAAGGGMSALVAAMLDALPHMRRARIPATQCLSFLESKLRELCVLSKSLADLLMSTDFCDMATLTQSLSIDTNDVPLLLAVATTHTPHLARRYGISYR